MNIDIHQIAQRLVDELNVEVNTNKARAEGVAMLYDRIREAIAALAIPVVPMIQEGESDVGTAEQHSEPAVSEEAAS